VRSAAASVSVSSAHREIATYLQAHGGKKGKEIKDPPKKKTTS